MFYIITFVVGLLVGAIGGYYIRKNNAIKVDATITKAETIIKKVK
jgi:uncharacterized protein YneF (UPF0154 family)